MCVCVCVRVCVCVSVCDVIPTYLDGAVIEGFICIKGYQFSGDIVANMLNCDIVVSEFEPQVHYHVHFSTKIIGKGMNTLIP